MHGARPWQPRARRRRAGSCAGRAGSIMNHAASAASAVAIAAIVSPAPSASTNACSLAARTFAGAPLTAAPDPSASTSRSRAGSGTRGSDCARSWRPIAATSAPSAATPNVPPTMRVMRQRARGDAGLRAVDGVHRRRAHRRHREAHAEAEQDERHDEEAEARVDLDPRLPGERRRVTSEQPDHERRARADAVGEAAGQRPGDHDHERRGQEAHAGLQRRVAEDVLHVEREEEEDGEHPEARSRTRPRSRRRTSASWKKLKSTIGARERRSMTAKAARPTTATTNRPMIRARAPAPRVGLDQREHERGQADRQRRDAGEVDLARRRLVARLVRGEQRHDDRDDRDRDVDEEDRAPADVLGQPAAEQRAERERDRRHARPGADRLAALGGRERVGDDRQRRRASSAPRRGPAPRARRRASPRSARSRSSPSATANTTTPIRKTLRRPKMSPSRPPVTSSTANDSE